MLIPYENRDIYIASEPTDFRMGIDGLTNFIHNELHGHLHDGAIYVFYNKYRDKIKCLFWDRNGFVTYYKRLDKSKFKVKRMMKRVEAITANDLEILLSGFEPSTMERQPMTLEHK